MKIEKAVSECLADLSLSKNTETTYRKGIQKFLEFLRLKGIGATDETANINVDYFVSFPAWLDKNYSKQTCGVYTAAAKAFFDYLIISKSIPEPSHYDILRYKKATTRSHKRHEDKLPRFPKKEDVDKMLYAVRNLNDVSPRKERAIALLEFLASSGCRISENHRPDWLTSRRGTRLELDFYLPEIQFAVEVQGRQHYEMSSLFDSKNPMSFKQRIEDDAMKAYICSQAGIKLVEISSDSEIEDLFKTIELIRHPYLPPKEERIFWKAYGELYSQFQNGKIEDRSESGMYIRMFAKYAMKHIDEIRIEEEFALFLKESFPNSNTMARLFYVVSRRVVHQAN